MDIYFGCSISGGRENREYFAGVIDHLKKHGKVLTEHFGDKDMTDLGEKDISDSEIYERDLTLLEESRAVVVDASTASLGVGYEIAKSEEFGKNLLVLYRNQEGKRISAMLDGNKNLNVKKYNTLEEACSHIEDFFMENFERNSKF